MRHYEPSGRIGAASIPAGLLGGGVAALLLAWVYQFLLDWIPFIYLNFFVTIFFGVGMGMIVSKVLIATHCRNPRVAGAVGLAVGAAGLAASFLCAYYRIVGEWPSAASLHEYIQARVEHGWTIGHASSGLPISGIFVYLMWLIEAAIVLFSATVVAAAGAGAPYCEACARWSESTTVGTKRPVRPESLSLAREADTPEAWIELPQGDGPGARLEYELEVCGGCDQFAYLSITHKWEEKNDKGETEEKSEELLEHAVLAPEQRELLRRTFAPPAPKATEA